MSLFRRGPKRARGEEFDLMRLPVERIEPIMADLVEAVIDGMEGVRPPKSLLRVLQVGACYANDYDVRALSREVVAAVQTAARLGYYSRVVEYDRFEAARCNDPGFLDSLDRALDRADSVDEAVIELCAALAAEEPINSQPDDELAPSWWIPGLGAEARALLRERLITGIENPSSGQAVLAALPGGTDDLRRAWKFGFFFGAAGQALAD